MAEALEGNSQKGVPIQAGATPTDDQGGRQPHKCSDAFLNTVSPMPLVSGVWGKSTDLGEVISADLASWTLQPELEPHQ